MAFYNPNLICDCIDVPLASPSKKPDTEFEVECVDARALPDFDQGEKFMAKKSRNKDGVYVLDVFNVFGKWVTVPSAAFRRIRHV